MIYILGLLCLVLAEPTKSANVRRLEPSLEVDLTNHRIRLDAEVVLREGPLELLLCPRRTKEHESVLAADVNPRSVQVALLMIGAKPGQTAVNESPPTGQRLNITVEYLDKGMKKTIDARQWIKDVKSGKPSTAEWVFAGSRFYKPPGADRAVWMGDEGDLICVANFPGAVIDVSIASSKDNALLSFEALTANIPERGTKAVVVIEIAP